MNAPDHLFSPRHNVARRAESAMFWLFRAATYFILLCGAVVFLDIVVKGGRTVFQTKAPFINTTFLTAAPESLYIFEWEGRKREIILAVCPVLVTVRIAAAPKSCAVVQVA